MSESRQVLQRVNALRPCSECLDWIARQVAPAPAFDAAPAEVIGATYAADIIAPANHPRQPIALHDGWAVVSEQLIDASSYAPAVLETMPEWVDAGSLMPFSTDAVLPVDALLKVAGGAEASLAAAPGEGVLQAAGDAVKGALLRSAGERVEQIDAAALRCLGFDTISVRRPRVKIIPLSVRNAGEDFISPVIADAVRLRGGRPDIVYGETLARALDGQDYDLAVTIGKTGGGRNDDAVHSLSRLGAVAFHGIAISPGQTTALGSSGPRPVLLLPGRLDAAISSLLVLGTALLRQLAGSKTAASSSRRMLTKKVSSTIGLTEVVFVQHVEKGIAPLGGSTFSLQAMMRADGWIEVPEGSEGLPLGAEVEVRKFP